MDTTPNSRDVRLNSQEIFDPERLLDIFEGDSHTADGVLEDAIGALREILERVTARMQDGNVEALLALLHELKGLSGNIGARELSTVGDSLLTTHGRNSNLTQPIRDLTAAYERFEERARAHLKRSAK